MERSRVLGRIEKNLRFERVEIRRKINRELFHDYCNSGHILHRNYN